MTELLTRWIPRYSIPEMAKDRLIDNKIEIDRISTLIACYLVNTRTEKSYKAQLIINEDRNTDSILIPFIAGQVPLSSNQAQKDFVVSGIENGKIVGFKPGMFAQDVYENMGLAQARVGNLVTSEGFNGRNILTIKVKKSRFALVNDPIERLASEMSSQVKTDLKFWEIRPRKLDR